jgi:hypothetical protein
MFLDGKKKGAFGREVNNNDGDEKGGIWGRYWRCPVS